MRVHYITVNAVYHASLLLDNDYGVTMRHIGIIQYTDEMAVKSTIGRRYL